ncbi:MAG: hypothetical protein IKH65_01150 [Clostridia bacterium]|nr:hypothetical protein [Clostridia bacterium]
MKIKKALSLMLAAVIVLSSALILVDASGTTDELFYGIQNASATDAGTETDAAAATDTQPVIVNPEDAQVPTGSDTDTPYNPYTPYTPVYPTTPTEPDIPGPVYPATPTEPDIPGPVYPATPTEPDVPGPVNPVTPSPTEPDYPVNPGPDDIVGEMYLCSNFTIPLPFKGHFWVYIKNTTENETFEVAKYELLPGEGVSTGAFGTSVSDGWGAYLNVESYCKYVYGCHNLIYIKKTITRRELSNISNQILNSNHFDPIIFNCVYYAANVWMAGGGSFIFPVVVFPLLGRAQLLFKNPQKNPDIFFPGRDRVYRIHGSGPSAYLTVVTDGSVRAEHG